MRRFELPPAGTESREEREGRLRKWRGIIAAAIGLVSSATRGETGISALDRFFGPEQQQDKTDLRSGAKLTLRRAKDIYDATEPIGHLLSGNWEEAWNVDDEKLEHVPDAVSHVRDTIEGLGRGQESLSPVARQLDHQVATALNALSGRWFGKKQKE